MKHVIKYLKETRDVYARMVTGDEHYLRIAADAMTPPYGADSIKDRLQERKAMLDELDDAIEILEGET